MLERVAVAQAACPAARRSARMRDGCLRFSIANSYEKLMDAVERIRKFLKS